MKRPCVKFAHPDRASADRHLRGLKAGKSENKKVLNKLCVYRCKWCQRYHVGHDKLKGKFYPSEVLNGQKGQGRQEEVLR